MAFPRSLTQESHRRLLFSAECHAQSSLGFSPLDCLHITGTCNASSSSSTTILRSFTCSSCELADPVLADSIDLSLLECVQIAGNASSSSSSHERNSSSSSDPPMLSTSASASDKPHSVGSSFLWL